MMLGSDDDILMGKDDALPVFDEEYERMNRNDERRGWLAYTAAEKETRPDALSQTP